MLKRREKKNLKDLRDFLREEKVWERWRSF